MTVPRRLKLNKMKIGEKYISTQIIRDPSFTMSVAYNRAIKKKEIKGFLANASERSSQRWTQCLVAEYDENEVN